MRYVVNREGSQLKQALVTLKFSSTVVLGAVSESAVKVNCQSRDEK